MQRLISILVLAAALCGCAATNEGKKIHEQGMDEASAGNVEAAIATLEKGVEAHPRNLAMRLDLGRLIYEQGELFHLKELDLRRNAAALLEAGRREEGAAAQREAGRLHEQAVPHYRSCQEHFETVISDSDDSQQVAWASFLAMRVSLFFEEWRDAYDHITQAIHEGKPTGKLLTSWRTFQANLREKAGGPSED